MRSLFLLAVTVAVASACTESPTQPVDTGPLFAKTAGNPVVGSASGSGHAPCSVESTNKCLAPGPLRTFSFNAHVYADGSVSGRAQTHNRANGNKLKVDIDCVNFFGVDRNRAWMIGTITHTNNEALPEGAKIGFAVADNGDGSGADPDQITGFGLSPEPITTSICSGSDSNLDFFFDNFFSFDAVNGNIQVLAPEAS